MDAADVAAAAMERQVLVARTLHPVKLGWGGGRTVDIHDVGDVAGGGVQAGRAVCVETPVAYAARQALAGRLLANGGAALPAGVQPMARALLAAALPAVP